MYETTLLYQKVKRKFKETEIFFKADHPQFEKHCLIKEIATKTRDNIGERTQEDRIKEFTKILMDSGVGTSKVSRSLAEKIEQSGLGMSGFESKEEAIKKGIIEENQLYFDKQGKTYKGKKVGDEIKLIEVQFTKSK